MTRQNYVMSEADFLEIMDRIRTAQSTPLIMLQCGMPRSVQEVVNDAWAALGKKMGFNPMTVEPTGNGARFFSAVPVSGDAQERTS